MTESLFAETRTHVAADHALITPDGHVESPLTGWNDADGVVLLSPALGGSRGGPRFVQYLVYGSDRCKSTGAAPGAERLIYVVDGTAQLAGDDLPKDAFAWFPPGDRSSVRAPEGALLLVFEKRYQSRAGTAIPQRMVGTLADAPAEPFLGDPDAMLSTLLPIESGFDMAVNVFRFEPGAALPFVETHVMEHGLYMKEGQGVYRLSNCWYPVQAGDSIWMASYCPQWFVAMGKEPAAYIYYKDIHRDPLGEA